MSPSAPNSYRETEVLTAPPERLQLMLVDGAIRFIGRARHYWQAGDDEQASEALIRAQDVISHLIGGLNREIDAELVRRVAAVYLFVFRALVDANMHRDEKRLDEAAKILEAERETWGTLCGKPASTDERAHVGGPHLTSGAYPVDGIPGGLSIEA